MQTRLVGVFEPFPEVLAVYLFGSRARGEAKQGSDYDLGVVFAPGARDVYLELLGHLVGAGVEPVDLVDLDRASPLLRFEAVARGRLIFRRPGFDHGSFFSRVVREYWDMEPLYRIQREAMKRRWLGGTPGGDPGQARPA